MVLVRPIQNIYKILQGREKIKMVVEQMVENKTPTGGKNINTTPINALVGFPGNSSMIQKKVIQQYVLDLTVSSFF